MRSIVALFFLVWVTFSGSPSCLADSGATAAFDKVKSLAGDWQGKDEDGQPAKLTYEVTSGGTAVMERLTPGEHPAMITMYHMDGDRLMATHYCARNNQPRMAAKGIDPATGTIVFNFIDATNLASPTTGHMRDLTLKVPDNNHVTQEWSWHEGDQNTASIFKFERQK